MKIIEKGDEIILRDVPFKVWIYGISLCAVFSIAGFATINDAIKYPNYTFGLQGSWFGIILSVLWFLFILFCIGSAFYFLCLHIAAPLIITKINPNAQTVEVTTGKLFFIKKTERFYFSQISSFEIITQKPDKTDLDFILLRLKNNSLIDLETTGSELNSLAEIREKLNKMIKTAAKK